MQNASRQEFDDALNSYKAPGSEFHADEWKNEVTSQAQGKERFFIIMCSLNSKLKSYVIYSTFTTCYVKGYQHVKNFNEDLFIILVEAEIFNMHQENYPHTMYKYVLYDYVLCEEGRWQCGSDRRPTDRRTCS